jgi:hypothetical protein
MNSSLPSDVLHYLEKKSYSAWQLEWNRVSGMQVVIVVPAICEFENLPKLIQSLSQNDKSLLEKILVIIVVNNSNSTHDEIINDNKQSIEFVRQLIDGNAVHKLSDDIIKSGLRIGLVDASSEGRELNEKLSGVGLARKIGMDLSLTVFDYSLPGKKIIVSLDADCLVDKNYIQEIVNSFETKNISVANIEFEHIHPDKNVSRTGIISYEIFLRHYVAGLLFAKSPFAFHTVGSTVVCDYEAYISAGGMNTKKAAEDFYFLQKLAKRYKIERLFSTRVKPSSRKSWRVPFGTGRTMMDLSSNKKEIQVYDPKVYLILKKWLELFYSDLSLSSELLFKEAKRIHPELLNFLLGRKFEQDWDKILENSKSVRQLDYQRKNLFDAFETLKLIHYLRDKSFPMIGIESGVKKLFQIVNHTPKFDLEIMKDNSERYLEALLNELRAIEFILYEKTNQ